MSKYILTGDMPKSCSECKFDKIKYTNSYYDEEHTCILDNNLKVKERYEDMDNGVIFNVKEFYFRNERNPQCPLQDTNELLEALEELKRFTSSGIQVNTAYNKLYKALGRE